MNYLLIFLAVLVILFILSQRYLNKSSDEDDKEEKHDIPGQMDDLTGLGDNFADNADNVNFKEDFANHENFEHSKLSKSKCSPRAQLSPEELLPTDNNTAWSKANPTGIGPLKDKNFLLSGHHVGIDTVGQTLRNANLQLRSEPPNPQVAVSPWLQTTIGPEMYRKPLEIGGCGN